MGQRTHIPGLTSCSPAPSLSLLWVRPPEFSISNSHEGRQLRACCSEAESRVPLSLEVSDHLAPAHYALRPPEARVPAGLGGRQGRSLRTVLKQGVEHQM